MSRELPTSPALASHSATACPSTRPHAACLDVRVSPGKGRGVFAAEPVTAGTVLGRFHTILIGPEEVQRLAGSLVSHYWFEDDSDGSAHLVLGVIELVNHSLTPNCERSWEKAASGDIVALFALRDIAVGEELFIDYRFEGLDTDPPWASDRR